MPKLTSAARKKLNKKDFAIPSKKTLKNKAGQGSYPKISVKGKKK